MTSSTDKLRRLLDECGVEWEAPNSACADLKTSFKVGRWYVTADSLWYDKERLSISMNDTLTPEQAIAATLGRGTCVIESTRYIESDVPDSWYEFDLSCGHIVKSEQVPPNYCEKCGKRIDLQGVSYA